jgi:aerotaxis receptor
MRKTGPVTQQEYLLSPGCTLVTTTDLKSRISYCNPAFIEASGYAKDELIGQPHNMIRHPDMPAEAFRDMWETVQSGLPWSGLVKNRRKNGDHYWVQANVTPTLENGQVSGYVSVRTCPSREAVLGAETLYARMRDEARSGRLVTVLRQGQLQRRTLGGRLRQALQWGLGTKLSVVALGLAGGGALLGLFEPGPAIPATLAAGLLAAWWLRQQTVTPLQATIGIANRMAAGDVGQPVSSRRSDENGLLTRALGQLKVNLQALVGDVREQVEGIEVASREISAGSIDLSSRTESQAANLQQTAASLEQISGNVQNNSRSALAASQLAEEASQLAAQSNDSVAAAVARMEEIRKASARIAEITQVVDALSFQTNLLALNAAVEAARAGEQGRGFAVVAGEVRSLASRTRDASKEIKQLIEASVAQVEQGAQIVQATGRSVGETRSTIAKLSGLVGEISLASQEQAQGVEQVHQAVNELDALTQQNAAMVEQLSASAASLSSQAGVVSAAVKIFRA